MASCAERKALVVRAREHPQEAGRQMSQVGLGGIQRVKKRACWAVKLYMRAMKL
jgi:hypothetical protein